MNSLSRLLVFFSLIISCSTHAEAKQAQVLLYPTRLVLENNERNAVFGIKNTGNATGGYRVELVDMHMGEEGSVEQLKAEQTEPFSARKFIRISPRSITLEPGQDQNIRILIRSPESLEAGEYRTHVKVTLVENNLYAREEEAKDSPTKDITVTIKPRLSLIVPLIIRHGETRYSTTIEKASVRYVIDAKGKKSPYADLVLTRKGNRSSMGDIDIDYINEQGKRYKIKHLVGLPIYRPTERRKISLPLEVPSGLVIGKGTLHITYRAQESEGGAVLAEGTFTL